MKENNLQKPNPSETLKLLVDFIKGFELGNVDKIFVDGCFDVISTELNAFNAVKRFLRVQEFETEPEKYWLFFDGFEGERPINKETYYSLKEILEDAGY